MRWWTVGNPVRAFVIAKRGKNPRILKVISKSKYPDLWERWKSVLSELEKERSKKRMDLKGSSKRVSVRHDKLKTNWMVVSNVES